MTREEAKEILVRYRAESPDTREPEVVEALELAARDAELSQWLKQQEEFHSRVRQELRGMAPPPELKARILAARPEPRISRWHGGGISAIAASIIFLLALANYFFVRPGIDESFTNFRSRMSSFVLRTYQMDIVTNNAAAVREYLSRTDGPADFQLTPALGNLAVKGGGHLTWQNHPVSMMCFTLAPNETVFMFVLDEKFVQRAKPPENQIAITPGKRLATAAWRKDGRIFLVAANVDEKTIAKLAEN